MAPRHDAGSAFERHYRPLILMRQPAPAASPTPPLTEFMLPWIHGLVVSAPAFVVAATVIRGWQDAAAIQLACGLALLALLWAYALTRLAPWAKTSRAHSALLAVNSAVLLLLSTSAVGLTGGAFSPLCWIYIVLISAETFQSRHRGLLVAWLSWILVAGVAVAHAGRWFPERLTGTAWSAPAPGASVSLHAFDLVLVYLTIAIAVSRFHRWVGRYERQLRQRQAACARQEQLVDASRRRLDLEWQRWKRQSVASRPMPQGPAAVEASAGVQAGVLP